MGYARLLKAGKIFLEGQGYPSQGTAPKDKSSEKDLERGPMGTTFPRDSKWSAIEEEEALGTSAIEAKRREVKTASSS